MGISALLASQILDASATGRSVITGADASAIRSTLGLGTLATQSPTGTPSASTFLRGDYSWQTIDLSGYVPYSGATGAVNLGSNAFTASQATLSAGTLNGTVLDIAQTWGGTGTYTGIKYNVTDSGPANAASLLMDLQVGGSSRVAIRKTGSIVASPSQNIYGLIHRTNQFDLLGTTYTGTETCIDEIGGFTDLAFRTTVGSSKIRFVSIANVVEQYRSTNPQTFRLYGTFTDASNYRRLFLSSTTAGAFTLGVEGAGTGASGNTLTLGNPVSVTGGTITTSTPALNVTQTWNNAATTFTGILANVTDTASNASSLLMDLQVGGSSVVRVRKTGLTVFNPSAATPSGVANSVTLAVDGGGNPNLFRQTSVIALFDIGVTIGSANCFGISSGTPVEGNADCRLFRDAADTWAFRRTTNAQVVRIYNTFTNSSNYERGKLEWASNVFRIGTEKAGTGSARALELQTDGVTRLTIGSTGLFTIADALDIAVGATTGTKIGTATTQKLGFYNATPVVQPTAVADATDAASVITQLNALLSRMRDLGLIAT